MSCPHRVVREVRVYPNAGEDERLTHAVGIAISKATGAPVGLHKHDGSQRGWVLRPRLCRECEALP